MKLTDADNAADGIFFPALEQNMMGAVLINENDEVMFFNPAAEKLWGYKREEVIGNNIDMLIPRDLRPAHPEYIRHNREGGKARVEGMSRELQLEKKDGSKIWTRFALSKVSAEGKVYYLALVRDASVEMAQKEQTRQLIIAVDHLDRPVIVLDPERHIVQCNRAFTEMFGYCISEASGMQPDTLLNIPEFPADNRIRLQQLLWKTARDQDEFLLLTRTGEKIWIKASISPVYDVLAHLQNLVMTFSDITEERQIRQLEGNILAAMCSSPPFHEMGEIICRNIESVLNESHVSLFALRNGMPIHWASSSHGAEVQNAQSWSATIRQRDGAPAGILQIKTSSGAETSAFIERVADISQHMAALALEQEKSRQHIEQLIQFDPMTGLPNRNNLHNYLDDLVDKAVSPVVYLIGVDHIQDVIDSLGYAWADQALLEVVNRFREKLKPDQYLCRIEGTQFVLVSLENDVSNITQIADELRNVVSKPIMIDNKPFPLTLSIGISYDVGKNRDYLLSTAHNAMDYIRKNGGNGWQFFSPAMNEMVKERLVLGAALKEAISNNQLKLVYQPQIFAETGELYGIEALARWHDPQHGHVPPSRFIPLAEEIGEIENIGRWVIAEACRQLAEWRSQNIHIPALSVNLSALHFRSNQLPNQVSDAMQAWGIDGHQLTVEITESMMMEHDTEIFKRIQILRDMGVGLSVDDFGTGFSGLSRLVSLPVTEIPDEHTVKFTLSQPFAPFLYTLGNDGASIINPAVLKEHAADDARGFLAQNTAGSGPFMLKSWQKGQQLVLVPNPHYPGNKPNFKRVSVKIIGESASRHLQLSRGDIDIADALPVDQLNALKQENKVNVAEYPSLRVTYLYLNNSKAPLNQADLRRAISWSTDYQGMVNGILSGNGKQMRGPIPEGMWGYDATAMQYNHDETKAKAEWDKVTSKPTSLTFLYSDNDPNWEPIALATQSSLNKLGINVKLEKLANATMRDRVGKGDYDIAIGNWSPDFADPYMFMNYWFESDKKGLPGNRSFYENSEVDKLLRNALATTDQTQRTRDYQQAQKIVIDDAAYVYLFQKNYQLAMNKEVKGFVFNPMLEQVFNINTMSK
ncbi:oxygen-sensing cyclic-di-GMP phosphodiesterase [Escherichia coli]|nr:oxygen-sensing cyclic-di-GMP phosphodiesterase [Escherichia coli]